MNRAGTPFEEALKEMARYIILGIISWLLAGGIEILLGFFDATLSFEIRSILITLFTISLRGLDRYLHEQGKADSNEGYLGIRGITYI